MRKGTLGQRWEQLEETEAAPIIQHNRTKNWDQIGKEADEEHKKDVEEGGGEAALQQMFKVFLRIWILRAIFHSKVNFVFLVNIYSQI